MHETACQALAPCVQQWGALTLRTCFSCGMPSSLMAFSSKTSSSRGAPPLALALAMARATASAPDRVIWLQHKSSTCTQQQQRHSVRLCHVLPLNTHLSSRQPAPGATNAITSSHATRPSAAIKHPKACPAAWRALPAVLAVLPAHVPGSQPPQSPAHSHAGSACRGTQQPAHKQGTVAFSAAHNSSLSQDSGMSYPVSTFSACAVQQWRTIMYATLHRPASIELRRLPCR